MTIPNVPDPNIESPLTLLGPAELVESAVQCVACIRFIPWRPGLATLTCAAFPAGIPKPILDGAVSHITPYPGDGGMTFEPRGVLLTADDLPLPAEPQPDTPG